MSNYRKKIGTVDDELILQYKAVLSRNIFTEALFSTDTSLTAIVVNVMTSTSVVVPENVKLNMNHTAVTNPVK